MKRTAPLSKTQYGVYLECMRHTGEAFYNIAFLYTLDGGMDEERLRTAVEAVVAAHPTLFTRIELNEQGEPVQSIDDSETFSLKVEHVSDIEEAKKGMVIPFDLHKDRLFHMRLLRDSEHFYLFIDVHHVIGDGTTLRVIVADIEVAYNGKALEPEAMTLADVALKEAELRLTPAFEEGRQWYARNFDCSDTFSQLIPDQKGSAASELKIQSRKLGVSLDAIDAFCKANGIFRSTFFTAAYGYLLAKYNNEEEALFSTVYNGRTDKRLLRSVAMLVKTVPVYAKFTDDTTVLDFLKAGQEQMKGCREHDIYAYTDVIAELNLQMGSIFAWHGTVLGDAEINGKPVKATDLYHASFEIPLYIKAVIADGQCCVTAEYRTGLYSEQLISMFLESYEAITEEFLSKEYLRDINISTKEQLSLLDSFNLTDVPYDQSQTIVSLFRQQAERVPENIAVVYHDVKLTYREVDELSDRIAAHIAERLKMKVESPSTPPVISVLIPRCEWMVVASLGVLKAGCAYQPLDPTYPKERLNFMMQDADAKMLIADEALRPLVDEYQGEVLLTRDIAALPDNPVTPIVPITPDSLFILLYTSGSTGTPKGCQITHANIVCFCHWYQRYYSLTDDCHVAAYASYGFDANMMDMYPALTCGASVYVIGDDIRLNLPDLNEYFEANGITHSFITTQVGYQFATNVDNHSLKHFSVGGEKLSALEPPKNYQMHNGYGPTECTIFTTTYRMERLEQDIPIGKPLDNMRLYIVDKQFNRLPPGAVGELWVSGPQVSHGYLNRPEKTAEVFIKNPFIGEECNGEKYSRVYRTGDIVRYLPDGNIQFVGRKDGQVKIRGFRIELKEVEAVIRQFPGIKDATVQAFDEEDGSKFIAAYVVSDEPIDINALNDFILDEKPPYMVPAVTMQIDNIPLNQNQKVNKKALPKPERNNRAIDEESASAAPLNMLEQEIHDIIAEIIHTEDFGITTLLGYAGLTSITSIKLAIQINKRFGVTLDSKKLAKTGSIQSIENEILKALLGGSISKQDSAETTHADMSNIPLSYAQMGVYVECMKQPDSTIYNIPVIVRFPKDMDVTLLIKAVETLVKSHPMLQAHFGSAGADIVQIVDPSQPIDISQSRHTEEEFTKYKLEFIKPFNLRQGPLYHIEIATTEEAVYLMMDIHHLVIDGSSYDVLLTQLFDLLNGKDIEPESFTYADFVAAQKAVENSEDYAVAHDFFHERLGNVEGVTEIPADLTNPKNPGSIDTLHTPLHFNEIEHFCRQHNISPAHLTLAATFYALSRFANNEQLCITTISNGRADLRISNTVGMFVNTLALSAVIDGQSVMEFLKETSRNFDETLRHESYPFARIAADYDITAEIMFAYQMGVMESHEYKGQPAEVEILESDTPKFSIALYIQNDPSGKPSICLQYDNGRYSKELMQNLAQSISNAADAFICNPDAPLKSVSLLDDSQLSLLDSFNITDVPYDQSQTIVSLFRRQAERVPENIAVVYHDVKLTYREVDELSDRIAAHIAERLKMKVESPSTPPVISVLIPRCEWMVVASLGVLKAGCAYQPLDPTYPKERLNFMMQDADAKMLIADEALRPLVDEYQGEVLLTRDIAALPDNPVTPIVPITPDSLFILLYTSGSTGTPKGCQITHANIVCFCHWYQRYYSLTDDCHVAAYASYGFDANMMDMYPALTCGASVYVIGDDIRLNLPDLNEYFEANGITHSFITTQVGYQFATNVDNHSLKHFSVGGEKLSALEPPKNYQMHNGYGPTECTIFTTTYRMERLEQDIPIGKPLDNMRLYIVDKQFNRLPPGAVGELWVSGPQVSHGYLNRPEKTAEVFIKNPFIGEECNGEKYSRVYRTGDIVRYLPDGNIQFVGRKDGQVKIRGFRIELKEVEAVIRQFPGIKDATVQAFDYDSGGKFIAAYVVSDERVDIKKLNAFIGKQKPSYMIPAATMQIDSIPLNQNQKVNKRVLPTPVIQADDHEYVEPIGDTEKLFCKIFSDVLSVNKIGATDNFFELGGTSLMVTKVIIEADKAGHHVAYGDVFSHPTPRLLAQFVTGEIPVEKTDPEITDFDYSAISELLQHNNVDTFVNGERQQLGNVLLTGATGYLGIHVLRQLIDSDAPTITCLVRGKNKQAAENRLKTLLFYYFDKRFEELFGSRIFVVNGDVTQDFSTFDLQPSTFDSIDTVFNCAANVKHFSKKSDIEDVNIGGAQRCVDFCLKTGARLVHISTTSVGDTWVVRSNSEEFPILDERKLWFGQFLDNRYIHSKFLAERLVLDAVARHGLSAKVMRVGNLAPRSYDGEFQVNFNSNSYMGRLKVFYTLGCCPYDSYDDPTEMSPIDQTAKAVVLLASTPKECTLFQPFNNHTGLLGDVLQLMGKLGREIRFVENEEFKNALDQAGQEPEKAKLLSAMMAYQDMAHGQKTVMINRDNRYTCTILHRLNFYWNNTAWDYVERMLNAISGFGYFE